MGTGEVVAAWSSDSGMEDGEASDSEREAMSGVDSL